jgi:hypothetical protein
MLKMLSLLVQMLNTQVLKLGDGWLFWLGDGWLSLGRVAKSVARLLATAALWVAHATHFIPAKNIRNNTYFSTIDDLYM